MRLSTCRLWRCARPVAADIRVIFNAPDRAEAEHLLVKFLDRYDGTAPKLVQWAEENLPQGVTVLDLPASHRRRLRTANLLERMNEEIRSPTHVARLFPNEDSCLRLVYGDRDGTFGRMADRGQALSDIHRLRG